MPDILITQTISTTDAQILVNCVDNPLVSIEVSNTWAGALNIETNLDPDNPVWRAAKVFTEAGAAASAAPTGNGRWIIQAAGVGQVRARLNPATSGGPTVTLRAGDNETFGLSGGGGGGGGSSASVDPTAPNAVELSDGTAYYQAATQTTAAAIKAKTDNLDVLLSTRTKPADQQHAIVDSSVLPTGASTEATLASVLAKLIAAPATEATLASILAKIIAAPATEATLALIKAKTDNLDVGLSTRTKPADQQHTIIDSGAVAAGGYSVTPVGLLTRGANVTAYAIGDEVGTSGTSPLAITVARGNGFSGVILGARMTYINMPTVIPAFTMLLFNDTVTLAGDNNPLALSDADLLKYIGKVDFTSTQAGTYNAGGTGAIVTGTGGNLLAGGAPPAPIQFVCQGGVAVVYAVLITNTVFTPPAASETIQILLGTEQNIQ